VVSGAVLDAAFGQVVETTAKKVDKLGFQRQGSIWRIVRQGNAGIIEFQKSTKNTSDKILFTVNLAVIYGALLEPDQSSLERREAWAPIFGNVSECSCLDARTNGGKSRKLRPLMCWLLRFLR
jgi:hypothetical protein